ncbi:MAG TPA: hypothetical protein VFQ39_05095, partial [Longimicrobium sp.]|nr:hypothetical protein [Longimicrobium sp.]
ASDIESYVRNYWGHLPTLQEIRRDFDTALADPARVPSIEYRKIVLSNTFTLLPHVIENSAHLRPEVFTSCVNFYDVYGRLEEIRVAHNECARSLALEGGTAEERKRRLDFLSYCLGELEQEYRTLIAAGHAALRMLSSNYWFLTADESVLTAWEKYAAAEAPGEVPVTAVA